MSGMAQVNPYYFELLPFIYWLAASFKRLSKKIKMEKEIKCQYALEKYGAGGEGTVCAAPWRSE